VTYAPGPQAAPGFAICYLWSWPMANLIDYVTRLSMRTAGRSRGAVRQRTATAAVQLNLQIAKCRALNSDMYSI
jgi:hypothetical protein